MIDTARLISESAFPSNWRNRLPKPKAYYFKEVEALLRSNRGKAEGHCPFCKDRHRCLTMDLMGPLGHWRCFACNRMGDIVDFHHLKTGSSHETAVLSLMEMR